MLYWESVDSVSRGTAIGAVGTAARATEIKTLSSALVRALACSLVCVTLLTPAAEAEVNEFFTAVGVLDLSTIQPAIMQLAEARARHVETAAPTGNDIVDAAAAAVVAPAAAATSGRLPSGFKRQRVDSQELVEVLRTLTAEIQQSNLQTAGLRQELQNGFTMLLSKLQ
jgi:hypothetical protein